ncbi:acyltransferase family protein [Methylobacterium sp. J-076]|uniref:acyltransferase family protein n=1 Tax=Methylobacterium sp. J-076 TaxID=2836655 RepID=UPI001FB8F476|nr:acyltransferase [Methylobacterium sp. J-076]MCJ2015742.1 acyltransferase [Methylobacterium sp. J-076]
MYDPRSTPAVNAHPKVEALPALTALRFVAAAYVVAFHYTPYYFPDAEVPAFVALGYSGVTFFFLLSGFILAYNYRDADLASPGPRRLFYRARVARVYPVYLLALAVHVPWFLAWVMKQPMPLKALMASGGVLAPLGVHAWVPGAACSLDCPSWSISVELFFYALFPILLPLVLRNPSRVALATLAFWVATLALATLLWQAYGGGASLISPEPGGMLPVLLAEFVKYFPVLHLPEFIAGLLLYVAWQNARLPGPALIALSVGFGALIVAGARYVPEPILHNGLTMLAWAPLILACAAMRRGLLCARPLVFLGKISFALYLLHIPVFAMLNTADRVVLHGWLGAHPWTGIGVTGFASLVAATLAHLLVEEPARQRILRRPDRPASRPAPAARAGA